MNLQVNVWGPLQWSILHLLSLSYTPRGENRKIFANRILSIFKTLPCSVCRRNILKNLLTLGLGQKNKFPSIEEFANSPYFESEDTLFYFTFALHNEINKMLNKPVISGDQYYATKSLYELALAKSSVCNESGQEEGCSKPRNGYKACMSKIHLLPRNLKKTFHGPAFYFDSALKK